LIGVILSLALSGTATPAAAAEYDEYQEPELVPTIQGTNVVSPGETTTLTVQVQNRGTAVTSAEDGISQLRSVVESHGIRPGSALATTVEFEAGDAPLEVKSGEQGVGTISPQGARDATLRLEIDEDASPGTYDIPATIEYQHIRAIMVYEDKYYISRRDVTVKKRVTVRIDESFRLEVVDVTGENLRNKENGTASVTVRNVGSEAGTNAELQMVGTEQIIPRTNGVSLGTLEPGETVTTDFRVGVQNIETAGNYSVGFRVNYEDDNGDVKQSNVRSGTVHVEDSASFTLEASAESLYIDSTGAVALKVTNTGDTAARNARAVLHPAEPFSPLSTSASLGTLEPGESTTARFKLEVADRAIAQEYPLVFTIEHDDAYDERVMSDQRTVSVDVGPEMTFETSGLSQIAAGSTETIDVTVKNTGDGVMRDAIARINVNTPFETDDDTAYVGDLNPGESRTVTFTVSVDGAATPKAYSVDTTIKYDNTFDRTVVTDIEPTSVEVTEKKGGFLNTIFGIFGL
jgi:hypothetical protein